jgi:hypothetical protein
MFDIYQIRIGQTSLHSMQKPWQGAHFLVGGAGCDLRD